MTAFNLFRMNLILENRMPRSILIKKRIKLREIIMNDKKKTNLINVLGVILTIIGAIPAGLTIVVLFGYTVLMIVLSGFTSSWIGSFSISDFLEGYGELFAKIGPYW